MMKPGCRTLLKEYGAFCNLCQRTPGSFSRVLQSTDDQVLNWGLEDGDFSNFVICSVINKFLIHSFLINAMYLWVCLFFHQMPYSQLPSWFLLMSNCPKFGQQENLHASFWHNLTSFWMIHCPLAQQHIPYSLLLSQPSFRVPVPFSEKST